MLCQLKLRWQRMGADYLLPGTSVKTVKWRKRFAPAPQVSRGREPPDAHATPHSPSFALVRPRSPSFALVRQHRTNSQTDQPRTNNNEPTTTNQRHHPADPHPAQPRMRLGSFQYGRSGPASDRVGVGFGRGVDFVGDRIEDDLIDFQSGGFGGADGRDGVVDHADP